MTYYTLPKLFRFNNNSIINKLKLLLSEHQSEDKSLLEKLLNTLIDDNKYKYDEIKSKYSFTDLLNLKLSDEVKHPKSYFAFIEINKICNIFNKENLVSLHISECYEYLDGLYQLRKQNDQYIFIHPNEIVNLPKYINLEIIENSKSLYKFINKFKSNIDLICINYDNILSTIKSFFISLMVQKKGGVLIIKLKRLNNYVSKEIIYLLMSLYENVLIIKPKIVNSVNEYKYIIAKNLNIEITNYHDILLSILSQIKNDKYIDKILDIELPQILINKIDECELIMSENTLSTHMKILNSVHVNNINLKSLEKKSECESKTWLKENL